MVAHSMQFMVESPFDTVFKALSKTSYGNVYSRKFVDAGRLQIGIILGERYFFYRTNTATAVSIILKEVSSNETEIEVFSYAGGLGLYHLASGAHARYVHEVKDFLAKCGFKIKAVKELPSLENLKFRGYP